MKGFFVTHNDASLHMALPTGGFGVLISNKNGRYSIICNGVDANGHSYIWYNQVFEKGDVVTVMFDDYIENQTFAQPQQSMDYECINSDSLLLDLYYLLEKELKEKGVL